MISEENIHYIRTFQSVRAKYGKDGSIAASPGAGEVRVARSANAGSMPIWILCLLQQCALRNGKSEQHVYQIETTDSFFKSCFVNTHRVYTLCVGNLGMIRSRLMPGIRPDVH